MSLIIKGISMPLTCWGCPCFDDEVTHYCCVLDRYCDDYKNNRLNDCPLVEVPTPHGRLIDADAYIDKHEECGWLDDITVDEFNAITPTIIEAEVSE